MAADEQEAIAKQLTYWPIGIEADGKKRRVKATGQTFDQNTAYFQNPPRRNWTRWTAADGSRRATS